MTEAQFLNRRRVPLAIALAAGMVMLGGLKPPIALAQLPNQSDNTGPNVSDITGPNVSDNTGTNVGDFGGQDGLIVLDEFELLRTLISNASDGETIARDISTALDEAYAQCQASISQAESRPRRFALGAAPAVDCTSLACERFNQLVGETRRFLAAQTELREQIRLRSDTRLW